jgi:hypothetical protein
MAGEKLRPNVPKSPGPSTVPEMPVVRDPFFEAATRKMPMAME